MPATPSRWTTVVTGGCSPLGRALCQKLLGLGHHVVVLDAMTSGLHPERWLGSAVTERAVVKETTTFRLAGHTLGGPSTMVWVRRAPHEALGEEDLAPLFSTEALRARPIEAVFHLGSVAGDGNLPASERLAATLQDVVDDAALVGWMRREQAHIKRFVCVSGSHRVRAPDLEGRTEGPEAAATQATGPWAKDSAESLRIHQAEALTRALAQATRITTSCVRVAPASGRTDAPLPPDSPRSLNELVAALLRTSEAIKDGATVAIG
jgi:nucleoside-diphosphate-sugar epimerase